MKISAKAMKDWANSVLKWDTPAMKKQRSELNSVLLFTEQIKVPRPAWELKRAEERERAKHLKRKRKNQALHAESSNSDLEYIRSLSNSAHLTCEERDDLCTVEDCVDYLVMKTVDGSCEYLWELERAADRTYD